MQIRYWKSEMLSVRSSTSAEYQSIVRLLSKWSTGSARVISIAFEVAASLAIWLITCSCILRRPKASILVVKDRTTSRIHCICIRAAKSTIDDIYHNSVSTPGVCVSNYHGGHGRWRFDNGWNDGTHGHGWWTCGTSSKKSNARGNTIVLLLMFL